VVFRDHSLDYFFAAARALDIPLSPSHLPLFQRFFQELVAWNRKVNLTRITTEQEVFVNHFIDSLIPARFMPPGASVVDIGSGAGFPGIPLKIVRSDLRVTLVDSSSKRVFFQRHMVRTLGLKDIVCTQERTEETAYKRNRYDICIGRAFASLPQFLSVALLLRAERGTVIAMKGPRLPEELAQLGGELAAFGVGVRQVEEFVLPGTGRRRFVVLFGE
jgi:16S rRNA (guanine527-N7)-methyltransferase